MGREDLMRKVEEISKSSTQWEVQYWDVDNDRWEFYKYTELMLKTDMIDYGKKESIKKGKNLKFLAIDNDKFYFDQYIFKDGEKIIL